jgi:hypothetical protein
MNVVFIIIQENYMVRLNVGGLDRLVRIIVGLTIMILTTWSFGKWNLEMWWGFLTGFIGLVLFITGVMAWCPFYRLLKTGTRRHITGG